MWTLLTEISIDAPPAVVWWILTNFATYPGWNSVIRRISGPLEVGQT